MNLTIFWFGSCSYGFLCFLFPFFQFLLFSGEPIIHRLVIIFTALRDLAAAERPQHCALVGLSATPIDLKESRLSVRASVRPFVRACVTAYLENRASDFSDFLRKVVSR